ncbi:MAG TPA: cupredoxin family copper-binding protein [Xanthobacteraceae bacterium]|jgi:plastocyanin
MKIPGLVRGAFAAALLWSLVPALPGVTSAARADELEVKIDNFTFSPQKLTVKAGTTVTWTNDDDIPHTVTSTGHFRSKALDTGDKYTFTFTTPGSFEYFCSLHPHMQGSVTVEAATGSLATQ